MRLLLLNRFLHDLSSYGGSYVVAPFTSICELLTSHTSSVGRSTHYDTGVVVKPRALRCQQRPPADVRRRRRGREHLIDFVFEVWLARRNNFFVGSFSHHRTYHLIPRSPDLSQCRITSGSRWADCARRRSRSSSDRRSPKRNRCRSTLSRAASGPRRFSDG